MRQALQATGRAIVHNIKGVPGGGIAAANARAVSNMRRCGDDIGGGFMSAVGAFHGCAGNQHLAGPGFWNDPGKLQQWHELENATCEALR